jgi:flavin reductase (DIM6/NTAB) family NADH-FMN oxidoreductase RutF
VPPDPAAKRDALRSLPHPVFIVGCALAGKRHMFLGTWLTQVSFKPPLVAFGCRKDSGAHEIIRASGAFTLSLLDRSQKDLATAFLGHPTFEGDSVNGHAVSTNGTGAPTLDEAAAVLTCTVVEEAEGGDHRVFVAEVTAAEVRRPGPSLTLEDTGLNYGG